MDYKQMTDEQIRDALYDIHAALCDRDVMQYIMGVSIESAADSLTVAIRALKREGQES